MGQVGIGTIFSQHQLLIRIFFFKLFYPRLDILYLLLVPTEITVHTLYIRIQIDRMFHMSISIDRNGITIRIFRLSKIMKRLGQGSCIFMRLIYFVMKPPYVNRRVIEALTDQFTKLALGIFRFVSGHPVYTRYFGPDNQSQCITTGIEII